MRPSNLSPAFILIFSTVLSLTFASGGTSLWLASQPQLSDYQVRIMEDSSRTWHTGIGVLFGLLGSKANELLDSDKDDKDDKEE